VLVFAVVGAMLSAAYMPALLDYIFISVQRSSFPQDSAIDPSDPVQRPVRTDKGAGQTQEPRGAGTEEQVNANGSGDGADPPVEPAPGGPDQAEEEPKADEEETKKPTRTIVPPTNTDIELSGYPGSSNPIVVAAMALLGAIIGGGIGNIVASFFEKFAKKWDGMEMGDKVSLFLGIFAGIVASIPFLFALQGLGGIAAPLLTLALVLGFSALSILALRSMEEVLPWNRGRGAGKRTGKKILDTNVIIDGRILDVARSGFLQGEIYVPKFVIDELQHIADSSDPLRRQRGRRGLEVLRLLQSDYDLEVGSEDGRIAPGGEVDDRLVKLALALGGDLVSNDYNLNKVASLQKVRVLNINDLALSLRPNVLPGELLVVTVIREGNQPGQGIGYLEDGTMVVIEHGRAHIGHTTEVTVTQVIQTERGKMIFGEKPVPIADSNGKSGR
jgi:uncharacterized protein YacL